MLLSQGIPGYLCQYLTKRRLVPLLIGALFELGYSIGSTTGDFLPVSEVCRFIYFALRDIWHSCVLSFRRTLCPTRPVFLQRSGLTYAYTWQEVAGDPPIPRRSWGPPSSTLRCIVSHLPYRNTSFPWRLGSIACESVHIASIGVLGGGHMTASLSHSIRCMIAGCHDGAVSFGCSWEFRSCIAPRFSIDIP